MIKKVLLRLAFDIVVGYICEKARDANKPWLREFCDFARELKDDIFKK